VPERRYRYAPGLLDLCDPNVIEGEPIEPGSMVVITRDRVDPLGRIVWVRDGRGNEQSVFRSALQEP